MAPLNAINGLEIVLARTRTPSILRENVASACDLGATQSEEQVRRLAARGEPPSPSSDDRPDRQPKKPGSPRMRGRTRAAMLERIGALGLSAEGFAKLVRVERGRTVRQWEGGERDIPGPVVILVEAIHASSAVRKCCSAWGRDANRLSNQLRFINIAGSKRRAYSQHFACDALGTVALLAGCLRAALAVHPAIEARSGQDAVGFDVGRRFSGRLWWPPHPWRTASQV